MNSLQNKIDFALVFKVKNANPNGDPLNGNRPRLNYDGLGEISDVCLKRKLRNRLQQENEEIFVQSDDLKNDDAKSLKDRFDKSKISKNNENEKEGIIKAVCEKWFDVRSFGQVFAFAKSKKSTKGSEEVDEGGADSVSIGIRGPFSIQSAFSVEPINIESIQITKSVNGENTETGKKSADTMGQKHRVDKAIYVTYGAINCQLAEKTGFTDEDAQKIKECLKSLFRNDASSARPEGSCEVLKLVWVKHNCKVGQYSSSKVHGSISVSPNGEVNISRLDNLSYEEIDGE